MTVNKIKDLITQQLPFKGSLEDFWTIIEAYPNLGVKLANFAQVSATFWPRLNPTQKQELARVIQESNTVEVFHEALGVKTEENFSYESGSFSCENLDYFRVNLDIETINQLKVLKQSSGMTLKLSTREVLVYEPISSAIPQVINSVGSKKTVQLALGLALLSFSAFNLQANNSFASMVKHLNPLHQEVQIKQISEMLPEALQEMGKSTNPQIVQTVKTLQNFNFKPYAEAFSLDNQIFLDQYQEADEQLVEEIILHFYEEKNPSHIEEIKPHIPKIAKAIVNNSEKQSLDFRILLGILKVESDFSQKKVSYTGDYSLAQINYQTWSQELKRVKKIKLNKDKLKKDIDYSIAMMTEILKVIESRHNQDPMWYARYHSSTPSLKLQYAKKVNQAVESIKKEEFKFNQERLNSLIAQMKAITPSMIESEDLDYDKISRLIRELQKVAVNYAQPSSVTQVAQNN